MIDRQADGLHGGIGGDTTFAFSTQTKIFAVRQGGAMRSTVGLMVLLLASCVSRESNILKHPLTTGDALEQRLPPQSPAVILVFEPADLVVCGNHISRWMEWNRSHPGRLMLVLKHPPSAADRKQLLLFRIRPDAILRKSRHFEQMRTPSEYLVVNGEVVLSQQVPAGAPESRILKAFEQGQVAGLLESESRSVR